MPMPLATPHAQANALDIRATLRSLARTGTIAAQRDSEIRLYSIAGKTEAEIRDVGTVEASHWSRLVQAGWVVPHESIEGWRLSNAGRIALKRMLSQTGEPQPNGSKAAPKPASPPASQQVRQQAQRGRPSASDAGFNDSESPLGWLRRRRDRNGQPLISEAQFQAGERLRADFTKGNMTPNITSHWSPVIGGSTRSASSDRELEMRDHQLRARQRFRDAMEAVGPEFCNVLVDVCCHLKGLEDIERSAGWPRRSAKVIVLLALTALARHYRLPAT